MIKILNLLGLIFVIIKTQTHIYLAKKYGRIVRIGKFDSSLELLVPFYHKIEKKDHLLKMVINVSYFLSILSFVLSAIISKLSD